MKILFGLLLVLTINSSFAQKFEYRESADVFQIVDMFSNWYEGQNETLEKYWRKNLEVFPKDEEYLKKYREIRQKYHAKVKQKESDTLFGQSSGRLDQFSHAFYSSKSVNQALKKLKSKLTNDEYKFLIQLFKHFISRISIFGRESTLFQKQIKSLNRLASKEKVPRNIKNLIKFLDLKSKGHKKKTQLLLAWWPKGEEPWVHVQGNFIIYHVHPHWDIEQFDSGKLLEEVVMGYLSLMSENQKKNFSNKFLDLCPIPKKMKKEIFISRPLAVVLGRIIPEEERLRKNFALEKEWSLHPWIQTYSKILFPTVKRLKKKREGISGQFLTEAASACKDLLVLRDYFKAFH